MKLIQYKVFQILLAAIIIIQSLVLAFYLRPMQDDYFNLQSVQQLGFWGYLADVWHSHGGNMVQFLIHCFIVLPTTQTYVFWNFAAFFVLNQLLAFCAIRTLVTWLFLDKPKNLLFWIPLLSVPGFEGLFVPGFIGTFGFSLATLAHLWPVMAVVVGIFGLKKFRGSWLFAFALGLIAGNSNLGESAFAVGFLAIIWILAKKLSDFEVKARVKIDSNFFFFTFKL
jgi:hypothetical protein